jgi:hypothetical protein
MLKTEAGDILSPAGDTHWRARCHCRPYTTDGDTRFLLRLDWYKWLGALLILLALGGCALKVIAPRRRNK